MPQFKSISSLVLSFLCDPTLTSIHAVLGHSVMSDTLRPHGPAGFLCPWDSPGKSTGVGCHFLLQSHPYMTTGKTIALTRQTFVGKVMSLLFNMWSRLVIPFIPRSKRLLISWLQSPLAVILEPNSIYNLIINVPQNPGIGIHFHVSWFIFLFLLQFTSFIDWVITIIIYIYKIYIILYIII